nr:MAG TPA: Minor capsid protein from bacteriophage [Caudoviricetes sp.]
MAVDKNQALVDYLITCPQIFQKPLYFNLADPVDGIAQFVTMSNDRATQTPFIDGAVAKLYSLTIICFVSITNKPIIKIEGVDNENIIDYSEIQDLIQWITEQNKAKVFPNFGDKCIVDEVYTTSEQPRLDAIDNSMKPALAKYSFTVNVRYTDKTDVIWN